MLVECLEQVALAAKEEQKLEVCGIRFGTVIVNVRMEHQIVMQIITKQIEIRVVFKNKL